MTHVINFSTALFDPSKEDPNDINPIPGQSVLRWFASRLAGSPYTVSEPATEDWGWYSDVSGNGVSYMVGASGEPNDATGLVDWVVQVEKHRTLKQRLTGAGSLDADDELVRLLLGIIRGEAGMKDVTDEVGD